MRRFPCILALALLVATSPVRAGGRSPAVIDYDSVVPLSGIEHFDGTALAPPVSGPRFRQIVHELHRASGGSVTWPDAATLRGDTRDPSIQLAVLNALYERDGVRHRVFAATALKGYTYRGHRVEFSFDRRHYLGIDPRAPGDIDIDFDDGRGYVRVAPGEKVVVVYGTEGQKHPRARLVMPGGLVFYGAFLFEVRALATPLPDDTLAVAATIPYESEFGTGEGYVYLADGHATITNPIVVLEGFDIDNSMNWDELYAILNDENLIEDIRSDGYDAVVFNFTHSTDPIQKNAFATIELLEEVQSMLLPQQRFALVGASMGGLVGRYALAYMETNAIPHQVATYISFDTPHRGANVPLGIQYWLSFFESESVDAAFLLGQLNSPAALQMLVYHYTDPPETTPSADPLRTAFEAELAALGNYPAIPRKVAVSNGSGSMQNQGFGAGVQIIDYNASIPFLATVAGNVWAVPNAVGAQIFEGVFNVIFQGSRSLDVTVSGTLPYDNAPGGWRSSMAQMDSTEAPIGDIIALYPNHCFIPTTSALDLATGDLFYNIASEMEPAALTPFDAVCFPAANQPHVDVTPENAAWLKDEIEHTPSAVPSGRLLSLSLGQNYPNPFNPVTRIHFELPAAGYVRLAVYDALGRRVAVLADRVAGAGGHEVEWDGRRDDGRPAVSGVYFCRLITPRATLTRKMTLIK